MYTYTYRELYWLVQWDKVADNANKHLPPRFSCPLALPTHMASSETVAHPPLRAGTVFGHDTVRHTRGSETTVGA